LAVDLAVFLQRRLSDYLETLPPAVVADVKSYLRSGEAATDTSRGVRADRHWTLLPGWLLRNRRFAGRADVKPGFLRDVLWGQYCLFLVVRIHDDLLDGQARSPALVFVADRLLVESERSFARHLQRASFWQLFRDLLDATLRAILEVDALQRRPGGMRLETVGKYADVAAIFKVGSAAVCAKCRRMDDFQRVSRFAGHLAVANQIVDDLRDVQEDLDRGRFNFVATHFGLKSRASPAEQRRAIGQSVLLDDAMGSLIDLVKGHYDAAIGEVESIDLAPAAAFVKRAQRELARFARDAHRSRVRYFLAPVIPSLSERAAGPSA
jgi:hypothetical protein